MRNRLNKFFVSVFLFFVFLIMFFLIGEVIFRFIKKADRTILDSLNDPKTRIIKPYVMFGGSPGAVLDFSANEKLNALGYRGSLPTSDKASGEFRIFVVGGSTVMFGEPPLPPFLEDAFTRNGFKNVKVFNFGAVSSESSQSLARILFEISDFKPDLIVMYEGGNDIMDRYFVDPRPGYPYNFMVYEKNPLLIENFSYTYSMFPLLAIRSEMFRSVAKGFVDNHILKLDQIRRDVGFNTPEWKNKIVDQIVSNALKGKKLSSAFGSKFLYIFQPLACTKTKLVGIESVLLSGDAKQYCVEIVHKVRQKISEIRDDSLLDYSNFFDDSNEAIFVDYIHIEGSKNFVIAEQLFKDITIRNLISQ